MLALVHLSTGLNEVADEPAPAATLLATLATTADPALEGLLLIVLLLSLLGRIVVGSYGADKVLE